MARERASGRVENGFDRLLERGSRRTRSHKRSRPRSPRWAAPTMAARSPRKSRAWRTLIASISRMSGAQSAAFVKQDRRNAQTLLPDLRGGRVVSPMGRAADVALMGAHDRPKEPPARHGRRAPARSRRAGGCRHGRGRSGGSRRPFAPRERPPWRISAPRAGRRHGPGCDRPGRSDDSDRRKWRPRNRGSSSGSANRRCAASPRPSRRRSSSADAGSRSA